MINLSWWIGALIGIIFFFCEFIIIFAFNAKVDLGNDPISKRNEVKILTDKYCPETSRDRRSIMERLFTLPWRPFKKYTNYYPVAYHLNRNGEDFIVVSPNTLNKYGDQISQIPGGK